MTIESKDIYDLIVTISSKSIYSSSVTRSNEDDKYIYILISEKPRFAISKKDQIIYGYKNNNINKKENYGALSAWREWNWSGYYPYRKSLYDWEKAKATVVEKPKRKKRIKPVECVIVIEAGEWPYTTGDRESIRCSSRNRKILGAQGDTNGSGKADRNHDDTKTDCRGKEGGDR